jgi:hypothetical protein
MYLANGTNTTNLTAAETIVYYVAVKKLIATPSVLNIMMVKKSGSPSV